MTISSAFFIVTVRAFRDVPVVWTGAVSAFCPRLVVTDPTAVSGRDAVVLASIGVCFALATILWTESAWLIPAAESGLLSAAEAPFAILFALVFLGEISPIASIIGGGILILRGFRPCRTRFAGDAGAARVITGASA
ncbi:MAG: hypothetical protein EOS71_27775 [Mesorhizobium sp.]|nr:MAG: hypothetical protein EOS71_27775 [Mesorhizobium sp.]